MGEKDKIQNEEDYLSLSLKRIHPEKELPGSLYIFLNGHFVHYKSEGDVLPAEKHNLFIFKKITHLFILLEDQEKFSSWFLNQEKENNKALLEKVGKGGEPIVELRSKMKGDLFELFKEDFATEDVQKLMESSRQIIDKVLKDNIAQTAMAKMVNYNQGLADHSLNVAFLSVYLAQNLGYTHQIILENVYLGALLHDIGKTRIDPKHFEDENSPNYDKAMLAHPELGKKSLLATGVLPTEVLNIVAEHHERNDGLGYPKGMKGTKIYDLTKIVSIANSFFDFMNASNGTFAERKKKALYLIENDRGHMFDPKKTEEAVKFLKTLSP